MKLNPNVKYVMPVVLGALIIKSFPHIYKWFNPSEPRKGIYYAITSNGEVACKDDETGKSYCLEKGNKVTAKCFISNRKEGFIKDPEELKKCRVLNEIILEIKESSSSNAIQNDKA